MDDKINNVNIVKTRDIWVISDNHFGHHNIIRYCDRPFDSVDHMNEIMIQNWNSVVKDGDIVYNLGDIYIGGSGQVLHRLKGRKRLILGNHDNGKDQYLQRHFQKIDVWRMFPEFGLVLTHVPIHMGEDESIRKYELCVHGHIHQHNLKSNKHRNVSVEQINYTPIHIEELRVK